MKAKKSLGQNFLIDNNVINKIIDEVSACNNDLIIEIGPGRGALTSKLKKKGCNVIAYELDTDLSNILSKLEDDKLHVIYKDFLNSNINDDIKDIKYNNLYLVGNLPYYITSPVIMMLLESEIPVEAITVMVQKEAAQRLCAKMGTRESGAITAAVNYYGSAKLLFHVSRGSFMPAPNVDSAVIQIRPDSKYRDKIQDKALYFKVIKGAFAQRRKTLANSLSSSMEISKDKIYGLLEQCGLEKNSRCEQLTMENWTDFVNLLKNSI